MGRRSECLLKLHAQYKETLLKRYPPLQEFSLRFFQHYITGYQTGLVKQNKKVQNRSIEKSAVNLVNYENIKERIY